MNITDELVQSVLDRYGRDMAREVERRLAADPGCERRETCELRAAIVREWVDAT